MVANNGAMSTIQDRCLSKCFWRQFLDLLGGKPVLGGNRVPTRTMDWEAHGQEHVEGGGEELEDLQQFRTKN